MAHAAAPTRDGDPLTVPGPDVDETTREDRPRRGRLLAAARPVAALVLLELAVLAAWWVHGHWSLGRVLLTNDGRPLTVEVLGASRDDLVAGPVALLDRTTLELPDGDYRLRVSGAGRLSRTYRLAVNRGELATHAVSLDDNRLLGQGTTIPFGMNAPPRPDEILAAPGVAAIEVTPGKADLIEWSETRLSRRDGVTGKVIWDKLEPSKPGKPPRDVHRWLAWFTRAPGRAGLVTPAPDLDGDGRRDLVWHFGGTAAFLAVSGKDGSVLWTHVSELDGPGSPRPEGPMLPGPVQPAERAAQVIEQPAVHDVDRDGTPDIIATLLFHEFPAEAARRSPAGANQFANQQFNPLFRRVIQAISGRSGQVLWTHVVDHRFITPQSTSWYRYAEVVTGRTMSLVGFLDGTKWRGLDPATGRMVVGPIDLGPEPVHPPGFADLDGDGSPELLAAGPGFATGPAPFGLAAFSLTTGRQLWSAPLSTNFQIPFNMYTSNDWPLTLDLDGSGRRAIVVPDVGALDGTNRYRGIRCLDGTTGRPIWTRPMRPDTIGVDGVLGAIEAPDLDGDGARDLVTASIFVGRHPINANQTGPDGPERVYIDAFSGRDGRPLWWWGVETPTDGVTGVSTPLWWGRGPDGWPLLAVPIDATTSIPGTGRRRTASNPYPPTISMLEASTGREVQSIRGLVESPRRRPRRRWPDRPLGRPRFHAPRLSRRARRGLAGAWNTLASPADQLLAGRRAATHGRLRCRRRCRHAAE